MKKCTVLCLALTALSLAGCGGAKAASALTSGKGKPVSDISVSGAAPVTVSDTASAVATPAVFNLDAGNNSRAFIASAKSTGTVEIKEKMFIAQVNDVYLNPDDYVGKTIKLQGLFMTQDNGATQPPYHFVIRYGPGCCGSDGNAGFEVLWENNNLAYPNDEDWVEAVGTFGSYEEDGYPYYCISLSSLKILDERGAEYVSQ
ncbi:MAG: hypothetical protein LBS86_04050 [Treponema sp.]|jgi:uncharacterized membrane protein YcgQ (UPF0703/DUF1980 family)|nr:hypothetical protein [Treponema sp.]